MRQITLLALLLVLCIFSNTLGASTIDWRREYNSDEKVILFPNPVTSGVVTVSTEKEIKRIDIINIVGQTIFSENGENSNFLRINLSNLDSGIYLIKVTFINNQNVTQRIWVK